LMSMAEISYQLKDFAKLMVGSEGYSPIAGWPFKSVLTRMRNELRAPNRCKECETVAIANGVVEEYVNYYLDYSIGGLSVEQSSLDLRKTKDLTDAIDNLAEVLCKELNREDETFKEALVLAHWKAQSFNGEQFVDLYDFCRLLQKQSRAQVVDDFCQKVLDTEATFVTRSCYSGPTYQYARGVSIYFPWAEIDPNYKALNFAKDSKWNAFLESYVVATRREPRVKDAVAYGRNSPAYAIRHTAGKHAPGKAMLPEILSMRNPPLTAGICPCVRNHEQQAESIRCIAHSRRT